MKKIKEKDIKVGDFVYGVDEKRTDFRFILKKTPRNFKVWFLKNNSEHLFEPKYFGGETDIGEETFKYYYIRKLNKKEIDKFNKLLILHNL